MNPEIMIPQVCSDEELKWVKKYVDESKEEIEAANGVELKFKFGTMIEVARACGSQRPMPQWRKAHTTFNDRFPAENA